MSLITLHSWPRAIAHIDADAFFASVEQALRPELKGRPVITGAERGIVAAASYEAKARGVKRGVPLHEVKKICPECVLMPSDYETYSVFSQRMFSIMRRFTPQVEEYSIDEAFADLTGLRRLYRTSYPEIGKKIQTAIDKELDITVSVGVSLTKSLAKLCSKFKKPAGLTAVPGRLIHTFLPEIEIEGVWGIGPNTSALLRKHGVKTAYDFAKKSKPFVEKLMGKIGREIWMELNGTIAYELNTAEKETYASISKSKTFTPPSSEPNYVFAQALRNLESACIKARRYNLAAGGIVLYLRRSDFRHDAAEARLNHPSSSPIELAESLKELFTETFVAGKSYRATGIVLVRLIDATYNQLPLFGNAVKIISLGRLNGAIDEINERFGKHTVFIGNGLYLKKQHAGTRGNTAWRKENILPGETSRQHINIPLLQMKQTRKNIPK